MPKVHANGIVEINISLWLRGSLSKEAFQTKALALHHSVLQNCSGRESWGILYVIKDNLSAMFWQCKTHKNKYQEETHHAHER